MAKLNSVINSLERLLDRYNDLGITTDVRKQIKRQITALKKFRHENHKPEKCYYCSKKYINYLEESTWECYDCGGLFDIKI